MGESIQHFYEFGSFRIDPMKRRLLRDGAIVPLTPKAFETLLALVEHGGEVVEKDDLIEKVWPGVAVEENNLTQNISALRKALGEKRGEPQFILTVPGSGYRFIAEVREASKESVVSSVIEPAATEIDRHSISIPSEYENRLDSRNWRRPKTIIVAALVIAVGLAGVAYRVVKHAKGATLASNAKIKSIAVLPFKPLSGGETG